MEKSRPELSIVIATLNSEKPLPKVLDAVEKQTYQKSQIELLVIDGGSTDTTRSIAKKYRCRVLDNPKIVPAWAKYIGFKEAKGKYLMYLDSDEVIEDKESIKKKLEVFRKNKNVYAVTGSGYKSPSGYIFLNQYINEFGDPFSFFYYRLSKDYRFFISTMKQRYTTVTENNECAVFNFTDAKELPIFELVAMASIVDREFLMKNSPQIMNNPGLIPHFFNLLIAKGSYIGITKYDPLLHYSADTPKKYLGKITSRIVNNIYTPAKEGFNGRGEFDSGLRKYKRYLFVPYSLSIVFPAIDALWLSITRGNLGYLIHIPLCLYTSIQILYYMNINRLSGKDQDQADIIGKACWFLTLLTPDPLV
jgi:glycosyltransferase involved in cell wall biosynthesis